MDIFDAARIMTYPDKCTMSEKYEAWATLKNAGCVGLMHKTDLARMIDDLWEVVGMETLLGRDMDQIDKRFEGGKDK